MQRLVELAQFTLAVFTMKDPRDTLRMVSELPMAFDDYQFAVQVRSGSPARRRPLRLAERTGEGSAALLPMATVVVTGGHIPPHLGRVSPHFAAWAGRRAHGTAGGGHTYANWPEHNRSRGGRPHAYRGSETSCR
ncbi:hypothetical protein OS965_40100 [Streptomyces sp. H27-G5]|uniref:hypothetical protein n=1 Tax=Streptomyces sp. H27-G5 TaxID=2996698 RepID=UPI00226DE560|nr:hypothetical protein [Streptomyces sp. H27-G5]MCY0924236.1 hypothetical protein [Streptomyces sp. H27-G5]